MNKAEHRQTLYDHMREVMANDRARHNILPLSKFGLMQITRQRVRPALDIATSETCPSCFGKGEIQPSLLFTDKLEEKLDYLVNNLKVNKFTMYIHPFVDAYVKKGLLSLYGKWRRRFGRGFKVVADESLAFLEYKVIDPTGKTIDLKEESDMQSSQSKSGSKRRKLIRIKTGCRAVRLRRQPFMKTRQGRPVLCAPVFFFSVQFMFLLTHTDSSSWLPTSRKYSPLRATSSECVPDSVIFPSFINRILSAFFTVDRRWAAMIRVFPLWSLSSRSVMARSFVASRDDVASSRKRISGRL